MVLNARGLEFPLNLYCDIAEFKEEDEARCYYYHKTADRLPPKPDETIRTLIEEYFSGRDGKETITNIYEEGKPAPENGNEREVIHRFFRDMLYYPRYNVALNCGYDDEEIIELEERRQLHIKDQFKNRENIFMPDLKNAGILSEETDCVLKKHGIRDLKTLAGLKKDEIRFYFRGDEKGTAEILKLLEEFGLQSFKG